MILVVAEQKDGRLNRASWEAVAAAQVLAAGASGVDPERGAKQNARSSQPEPVGQSSSLLQAMGAQ